jgi:hypothetical protein
LGEKRLTNKKTLKPTQELLQVQNPVCAWEELTDNQAEKVKGGGGVIVNKERGIIIGI